MHHLEMKTTEEKTMKTAYQPRNDFVLFRKVNKGTIRGVVMPDAAAEGKELVVEAIGPSVEGLQIGDVVLAIGTPGEDLVRIPGESNLFLTRQQNVVLVITTQAETDTSVVGRGE